MPKTLDGYAEDFAEMERLVSEYAQGWAAGAHSAVMERSRDKLEILSRLSEVEASLDSRTRELDGNIRNRLDRLGSVLGYIDEYEGRVDADSLARAKAARREARHVREQSAREQAIAARIAAETQAELAAETEGVEAPAADEQEQAASRLDAAWQRAAAAVPAQGQIPSDIQGIATTTMDSIDAVTKTRMPAFVAKAADFLRLPFREEQYAKIAENREKLDGLIARASDELAKAKRDSQAQLDSAAAAQVEQLSALDREMESERAKKQTEYYRRLKGLLLDGLEDALREDGSYIGSQTALAGSLRAAGHTGSRIRADRLCLGVAAQKLAAGDDGTLDLYLGRLFGEAYADGCLSSPVALNRHISRPICASYYSERVESVYPLFSNYALQMADLFAEEGCELVLCDIRHAGAMYEGFRAYEGVSEGRGVTIVGSWRDYKKMIISLVKHDDEMSRALGDDFDDVEDYNRAHDGKLPVKAVFISSVSELSDDQLASLTMLAREGCRHGIYIFVGASTDELQESGVVSQARASAVNALASLCDRIYLSSGGRLGLGNGRPKMAMPPEQTPSARVEILEQLSGGILISRIASEAGDDPDDDADDTAAGEDAEVVDVSDILEEVEDMEVDNPPAHRRKVKRKLLTYRKRNRRRKS